MSSGLIALGLLTVVESARRLASGHVGTSTSLGVAVAAVAIVVLAVLATIKVRVARAVGSPALRADGYLSGAGALLAGVAVVGATLGTHLFWVDPVAALVIALCAAGIGVVELRRGLAD